MNHREHIVIVNDDPVQLKHMRWALGRGGYEVRSYPGGVEMLADLPGKRVDLFVLDLHMPEIDGWKLCSLLRSPELWEFNETPILVVSATFSGVDAEEITSGLGADAFLPVPYSIDELFGFTRTLLADARPRKRSRVLVVEDELILRASLAQTLEANGFDVSLAASVSEANIAMDEHSPHVVLTDYHLSGGSCVELLENVCRDHDDAVVLVMTGDPDPSLAVDLLSKGADGYIRKPFDTAFLIETIRKSMRERSLLRVEGILEQRTHELGASQRSYRALFDAIPDLILLLDESNHVVQVNPRVCMSLGRQADTLTGAHISTLAPPESRGSLIEFLDSVTGTGPATLETCLQRLDGSVVDLEVTCVETEHEQAHGRLLVGRDLADRKRIEKERRRLADRLSHAQRLESLGVMAGGIAHDFNNLLVGMLGNASLALMDIPADDPIRAGIVQIEVAAKRAAELTAQILTFAGKGPKTMSQVDLSELTSEMGELLSSAVSKRARVSYKFPSSIPPLLGDPGQLRQVVMNLIMNASDALGGESGSITVETGTTMMGADEFRLAFVCDACAPGRYVYLEVRDDGCGMPDDVLGRIFDPFFTTKPAGRGLGLASTLGIIRSHGGVVELESALGEGTRFRTLFPAQKDPARISPPSFSPIPEEGSLRPV